MSLTWQAFAQCGSARETLRDARQNTALELEPNLGSEGVGKPLNARAPAFYLTARTEQIVQSIRFSDSGLSHRLSSKDQGM